MEYGVCPTEEEMAQEEAIGKQQRNEMKKQQAQVKADGRTTCCNAYTSIDDRGVEYCKACYKAVHFSEGFEVWRA